MPLARTVENLGLYLTHLKLVPGDTPTGIGQEFYIYAERELAFTSGGTYPIVAGDWIVGATGGAKAEVISVTLSTGAWADGDAAGILRIRSQHGTFQSENLNVAGNSNVATIAADSALVSGKGSNGLIGKTARAARITVTVAAAYVAWNGMRPDTTALVGHEKPADSVFDLKSYDDIIKFKAIDRVSGGGTTLDIAIFF